MKKSTICKRAVGRIKREQDNFACNSITAIGLKYGQNHLAEEVRNKILSLLENRTTLDGYNHAIFLAENKRDPVYSLYDKNYRNYMKFNRVKLLEFLYSYYKEKGE